MYKLILTRSAEQSYAAADKNLVTKLNRCFSQLRGNPREGANIRRLRGQLKGCSRYRLGDWRVVYRVDEKARTVLVLLITHRSKLY